MSTALSEQEVEAKLLEAAAKSSVIEEWTTEAWSKVVANNAGKKTVAICGFSPTSRHLAPFDDPTVECWGVNEAHRHQTSYMKRWTRWWQLHKRWDFSKGSSAATKEHWEWLKQPHDFPIYMQEHWDDIPSSVAYPFDFVREKCPGVMEILPTGEEIERDYYTSTFAYMCALAIAEGFERICVYGFDMATFTEFSYQKGSTEYWIGYARGRGIEVTVPYKCRLINGKLYGYEVSRVIPKFMLEELAVGAAERRDKLSTEIKVVTAQRQEMERLAMETADKELRQKMLVEEARPLFNKEVELARDLNVAHGEVQEYQDIITYIEKSKTEDEEMMINRQLVEFRLNSINRDRQKSLNTAMVMKGRRSMVQQDLSDLLKTDLPDEERDPIEKKGTEAFQAEFDAAAMVNALYGRAKASTGLMRYLDNMMEDDQMIKAVMDDDPIRKVEGQ